MFASGRGAAAGPPDTPTVVLHVTDYVHVPPHELQEAQTLAAEVYTRIGVRLVWTDGFAAACGDDDGARHLDVIILTPEMTAQRKAKPGTFGAGSRLTRHAFIYYQRAIDHAIETRSDPRRVLGLVLAHETGHMLLPVYSHSESGLMRAEWEGRLAKIPDFLPSQADEIRKELGDPKSPH
jgi:hypothetical protein